MLLPAPVTFSTTTGLPHASPNLSASSRAGMSGATPGGKPTTILMPCSGYACANAGPAASNAAPMAKTRRSDVMAACLSRVSCDFQIGARQCYLLECDSGDKEHWDRGRPARLFYGSPPRLAREGKKAGGTKVGQARLWQSKMSKSATADFDPAIRPCVSAPVANIRLDNENCVQRQDQ